MNFKQFMEVTDRSGLCYELSGRYVSNHPDAILIHGHIQNPFNKGLRELDHAWVIEDDEVFDPVMNDRCPKKVYYSLFDVKEFHRYDHENVLKNMLRHKHWGPW